jgi:hypothetical protein
MTPGQALLLQQVRLVAALRGWGLKKTIMKTRQLMDELDKALQVQQETASEKLPSKDEAKLIAQAEEILKSFLKDAKPENDDADA